MPQVKRTSRQQAPAYGTQPSNNSMTFQERLMKYFQPHQYVIVQNIDDEVFTWQYLPEHEENVEFTPDPMKITRRGEPEVWELNPGETETIIGASAYLMIEGLYKKLVSKKKLLESPESTRPGKALNFSYADGMQQEEWIKKIFIGIATPTFNTPTSPTKDLEVTPNATSKPDNKPVAAGTAQAR